MFVTGKREKIMLNIESEYPCFSLGLGKRLTKESII